MPTIHNFLIALSILQVTLLVAYKMNLFLKQKIQEVEHKKIGNEKEEMVIEQYNKMPMKPPKQFSGNVTDWPAQKVGIRSSFGLSGLLDVLDNEMHAATHPARNTMVYHFLNQSVVKGCASSTFSKAKFINDGYAVWK